ncbi:protein kinase domain protein [Ichthyophthirius multifiliis]|uniref:Protein kinase domain protein n=1 Tax=Ichthyophthirius multifiliis TaxID=5932 RepID=G0QJE4_ICHMU|nr:protein kinase domain protein [Ichthyophthirius multifiliis]EGR34656.1 protein kinase domain protein [Ichthyophthirius multifiliis]|eukprot:XP_004039960.1 protein kinase domain protein [Ichthyophthirius multifiliis]
MHSQNIVHRDIKLENILLDDKNNAKIIDFGFSIITQPLQKLKIFCGTPNYMAPEIVAQKSYCGFQVDVWALDEEPKSLAKSPILDEFIDSIEKQSISLVYLPGKGFKVYKYQETVAPGNQIITINKNIINEIITEENISRIISISLMSNDPLGQFYQYLCQFYIPALKDKSSEDINRILEELKVQLDSSINGIGDSDDIDENNVRGIYKPIDEFDFWVKIQTNSSQIQLQKKSGKINEFFGQIDSYWRDLKKIEFSKIQEVVEKTIHIIDKVWNMDSGYNGYNENRMIKLIEVFQISLVQRFQVEFKIEDVWDLNQIQNKIKLIEGQKFLKSFLEKIKYLVSVKWKQGRKWTSQAFNNQIIEGNIIRISEVIQIRDFYEQLSKIENLNVDYQNIFQQFKSINCLNNQVVQDEQWQQMKQTYKEQIKVNIFFMLFIINKQKKKQELINHVQSFLKRIFSNIKGKQNNQEILDMFQKWSIFFNIEEIKIVLSTERNQIINCLINIVEKIKLSFSQKNKQNFEFSNQINDIIWAYSLNQKLHSIMAIGSCFNDINNQFNKSCEQQISIILQMVKLFQVQKK